jgi:type II secretory pathway pseudopilin PulG
VTNVAGQEQRKGAPGGDRGEAGFSLVEAMVASLVLTVGLVGLLQLLAVATVMHSDARQATSATLLAQSKIDELMKLNLATAPAVQEGGSISANEANYFDTPEDGVTRRWLVEPGPVGNTRLLTVKVINKGGRVYGREQQLTTIIRQW